MKRLLTGFFLVLWTGALCTPCAARFLSGFTDRIRFEPFPVRSEHRQPAFRPTVLRSPERHVPWKELGRAFESWYDDTFPWRTELIRFNRRKSFAWLKEPVGREVPGRGNRIFRRGGDWPELDELLGAKELSPGETADWVALFEGRREWAKAMGTVFLTLPATTKARAAWRDLPPGILRHKRPGAVDRLREALADSPARDDVLFADEDFEAAAEAGRETFYGEDHHPSAYGLWLLYDRIGRRLAQLFPGRVGTTPPWFDDPPPAVLAGEAPGCWERNGRMAVSVPGEIQDGGREKLGGHRFPYCNVSTVREGGGLSLHLAHDSFMRFSLASWRGRDGDVRFPFPAGVGRVRADIFSRLSPGMLEVVTRDAVPDVLVDQFPACRLDESVAKYLDATMRAAAAFGRAAEPGPGRAPAAGDRIAARAVFERVAAAGKAKPEAVLRAGGREIARRGVEPGVKRAVFFDPVLLDASGELSVSLEGGTAASADLVWRLAAPEP